MSDLFYAPYPSGLRFPDGTTLTFGRIGRSFLGHYLLAEFAWMARDPMGPVLRDMWARYVKRNPTAAIRDWAELNGSEVDAKDVMRMLKGAREGHSDGHQV